MNRKGIRVVLTWIWIATFGICGCTDIALCQQPGHDQVRDTLLSSLPPFFLVGLAAAVAAYAVRMIRQSR